MIKKISLVLLLLVLTKLVLGQDFFNKGLVFVDINGDSIKFDDYKGKVLVINVWGTWCGPCVGEIPRLNGLVDKYNANKIEFIAITNESAEKVSHFLVNHPFRYRQIVKGQSFVNLVQNKILIMYPINLIFDSKGKQRFKRFGASDKIDEILSKKIDQVLKQ